MQSHIKARIIGLGSYLPERILSNNDLEKMVDTSDEWILSRSGIKERRLAESNEFASDMGANAAKKALEKAKVSPDQIDIILVATMTPDYPTPSTAALIQHLIGATRAAATDIEAACTGYLYGLSMAKAYVESGMYRNVLLIATEKLSAIVDYKDRNTCVLFGDGASAAVISNTGEGLAINTAILGCNGGLSDLLLVPAGGARSPTSTETIANGMHFLKLSGKEVFRHAVRQMQVSAIECLAKANLKEEDISWLVPHQANMRIIDAVAKNLNVSLEKVYKTVHKYGNTSASGVAIALDELTQEKVIVYGENLLLVAFGAGLTWGAVILTKVEE